MEGEKHNATRTVALRTFGACEATIVTDGSHSETHIAPELTTPIDEIPTEPETVVYSVVGANPSWPGNYEMSHSMEWFRSLYLSNGNWLHDVSIQAHAYSRHIEDDSLVPECSGWGYKITGPDGRLIPLTEKEMHGVHPGGQHGEMPAWTGGVMDRVRSGLSAPPETPSTEATLHELMDPADGFDFDVTDGFRWLQTYDYWSDDIAEQVSTHHRVFYESPSPSPTIHTNATVRTQHRPYQTDEWFDIAVTTNGPSVSDRSDPVSLEDSPDMMSTETKERFGIRRVGDEDLSHVDEQNHSGLDAILETDVVPEYVMLNCPWPSESEVQTVDEDREPTV